MAFIQIKLVGGGKGIGGLIMRKRRDSEKCKVSSGIYLQKLPLSGKKDGGRYKKITAPAGVQPKVIRKGRLSIYGKKNSGSAGEKVP